MSSLTGKTAVPAQMEALVLGSYGPSPFPLTVETRPVPAPGNGEVLVRMAASPVNPSDLHFLEGEYAFRRTLPAVPGLEGCGRVVAVGSGLLARRLAGKRVACAPAEHDGTWAQYTVASATQCFACLTTSAMSWERWLLSTRLLRSA